MKTLCYNNNMNEKRIEKACINYINTRKSALKLVNIQSKQVEVSNTIYTITNIAKDKESIIREITFILYQILQIAYKHRIDIKDLQPDICYFSNVKVYQPDNFEVFSAFIDDIKENNQYILKNYNTSLNYKLINSKQSSLFIPIKLLVQLYNINTKLKINKTIRTKSELRKLRRMLIVLFAFAQCFNINIDNIINAIESK